MTRAGQARSLIENVSWFGEVEIADALPDWRRRRAADPAPLHARAAATHSSVRTIDLPSTRGASAIPACKGRLASVLIALADSSVK
jgi:hypothetical protein